MKQESNRQTTMEDIDGGLHPAVDRQSLGEDDEAAAAAAAAAAVVAVEETVLLLSAIVTGDFL